MTRPLLTFWRREKNSDNLLDGVQNADTLLSVDEFAIGNESVPTARLFTREEANDSPNCFAPRLGGGSR